MTLSEEQEREIKRAWVASEMFKLGELKGILEGGLSAWAFDILATGQVTPYYHFKADYIERNLLQASSSQAGPQGRESGGGRGTGTPAGDVSSGVVSGATGQVGSTPRAAAQSKGPAKTVVRAHVEGKTMPLKEYLKGRGGTWDPNRKVWVFRILGDAFEGFCKEIESRGLKVVTDEVE